MKKKIGYLGIVVVVDSLILESRVRQAAVNAMPGLMICAVTSKLGKSLTPKNNIISH